MTGDWHVAIYCHNERENVVRSIASVLTAIGSRPAVLSVVVNGSSDGSAERAAGVLAEVAVPATVHVIDHADKSNAINQFLYRLRLPGRLCFGVDAHCTIAPAALADLATCLAANPEAQASTGVAGNGRTMRAETVSGAAQGGRLNGPLYALRPDFVDRMVGAAIRLPVDLYRGDGLLGSLVAHDLDAMGQPWNDARTLSVPTALFYITQLTPFVPADVVRQFRRKLRQMRGMVDNAIIKDVIYRGVSSHCRWT